MDKSETKQFLIYFRPSTTDKILSRRFYIAGSAKEAACAFEANMPEAIWVEVFELIPALVNNFIHDT